VLSFSRHDLPIDLPAIERFRARGGMEREYILPELMRIGWSDSASRELRNETRASLNFRLVEVFMMLLLPLLAVALAVPPKRSTSPLGVFVSIIMVVAYHKINEYGQAAGAQGRFSPELILWGPFALFAALILWMYWRVAYVPGGQPIGALEKFFATLGKRITALWKRQRRRTRSA
jgi:lipopolysaccharide export system permease protein